MRHGALAFNATAPQSGSAPEQLAPRIRRLIAPNPGPFTFSGTCTYIVGSGEVAVIDPGPDNRDHIAAILAAVAGERVIAILVTHTHRDHSTGVPALVIATGAATYGAGPHQPARQNAPPLPGGLDAAGDLAFLPDHRLSDGDSVSGPDWRLTALATPGHCVNHLCYALDGGKALFSGDHVMAWSTSIVAPPDGSMRAYRESLQRLLTRPEKRYFPGHGAPVEAPHRFVRGLIRHRRMREAAILRALLPQPLTIPELVARVYTGLSPALAGAAALNSYSQLEDLIERNLVQVAPALGLDAVYSLSAGARARVRRSLRNAETRSALRPKS